MRGRLRVFSVASAALAAVGLGLAVSACGGGRDASGTGGSGYSVKVASGFPASQQLAQQTHLTIDVTNTGTRAIPDVMVTLTNPRYGTGADALSTLISDKQPAGQQPLASRSRPVWMLNREPGPCEYSCRNGGGPGGAINSDADTWALGRLRPGHTAHFDWQVTAVRAGSYAVGYQVAAGPDTGSKAVLAGGAPASGRFNVRIAGRPVQLRFTPSGRVVTVPGS